MPEDTKTKTATKATAAKPEKNTGMAIVAYLIFFIPLLTDAKNKPFVKYHVKQAIGLVILVVVGLFIGIIPFIGWLLALILPIFEIILLIIGIINAAKGVKKPLPLIGQYAEKINI